MAEPPQSDPFIKAPESGAWVEPTKPQASPASPGYAAPQQPGYAAPQQPGYAAPQQPGYAAPQQPGYPAQPQQPMYPPAAYQPYGYSAPTPSKTWMNIVSLCMVPATVIAPGVANIVGIVFGHLGVRAASRGEAANRGVGMAGLILNYIIAIGLAVGFVALFAWAVVDCANDPYCSGDY